MPAAGFCVPGRASRVTPAPAAPELGARGVGAGCRAGGRWPRRGACFWHSEPFPVSMNRGRVGLSSSPGWQCRGHNRSRPRTPPSPASGTRVSPSLFPGRGPRAGHRSQRPRGFSLLFYSPHPPAGPGFGPAAVGRGALLWKGRDGHGVQSSVPGARPGDPAAGGGEGRCAVRAVAREAPTQAGNSGGGAPGTLTQGRKGPAPWPDAPCPPAARWAAALPASGSAHTPPPRRDTGACSAPAPYAADWRRPPPALLAPPGPFFFSGGGNAGPRSLWSEGTPRIGDRRHASPAPGPGCARRREDPERALPGLAWACSEPGCLPR